MAGTIHFRGFQCVGRFTRTACAISILCVAAADLAPAQQSSAATSGGGGSIFAPGGHNTNQPIEIASDKLEVRQENELAIFLGNVDAIQGDMRLKTDKLEVYYEDRAQSENAATEEDSGQSIRRMKATGSVFVTSPRETAQGEWADFDVVSRTLSIHDNVLLTRGANVLCGQQLDMNLDTGVSELKGGCKTSAGTATRVQGVFFPSKSETKKNDADEAKQKKDKKAE